MSRIRYTEQEKTDRRRVRGDLWKEGMRLANKPEIREFILEECVRVEGPEVIETGTADFDLIVVDQHAYYEYAARNKNRLKVQLKSIIRDNILPALKNDNVPHAWGDVEEKIEALEFIVRTAMVPRGEKPWLPPQASQGQGQGGPPN